MKRFALALMAAAVAVFGFGMVAEAQYGAGTAPIVVPPTVVGGSTFTITITGCTPGEILTVTFNGTSQTVTCVAGATLSSFVGAALLSQAPTGTATATFAAPTEPGTFRGTVVGNLGFNQSFQTVVTAPTAPPTGLPATGSGGIDTSMTIAASLFAVGLGLLGLTTVRRRQSPSPA